MSLILPTFDKRIKPPLGTPLNPHLPINQGLVGCWLMNEGAGRIACDVSGNKRHAALINDVSWVPGTHGPAMDLPGSADYLNVTTFPFPAAWTISMWVKLTAGQSYPTLFGWAEDTYPAFYAQYSTSGRPLLYMGSNNITYYDSSGYSTLIDGAWHCVTITCPGSYQEAVGSALMYVDGVQIAPDDIRYTAPQASKTQFRLGAGKASYGMLGQISSAMYFSRVLTPTEIASLYVDPYQGFRRPAIKLWGAVLDAPSGTDYSFTINDGMGVADDRSNLASLIRSVAEGLGLSDNASSVSSLLRTLSDAMGIEDAESASAAIVRGLNEAVGLTDAESKLSVAVRQVADSLGLVDSVGCLSVLLRTISDAEGVTDGQILSRMLVVADEIGAADEIGRVVAYLRTKSESVGLSDEMIEGATAAIAKTISDAMGLSDEAVRLSVVVRGVLDGIGIADAAQRLSVCLRVVTDSLGITDGTALARSMAVAETMGLSSSWSKAVGYLRAQSDSMSLADDYASAWAVLRTIDETLGVTDQMIQEGVAVLVRIISDVVGATDSRSQVHEALRVLTESVATSDSVARLFAVSRVIAEVEGLTDVASRGRFYMIADTLGISDEVARLVGFLRSCDEGVGVIEAILRVSGVVRRLDDSMGVTDSEQHFLSGLVQAAMAFLILRKGR